MDNFAKLPEECISEILSFTSPADVSAFSIISKRFKSASDSDNAWSKFVPSDIDDIISKSSIPLHFELPPTKKLLFLSLCDNPIVLEAGKKILYLDKFTGKKCVMFAPSEPIFTGPYIFQHKQRRPEREARFKEVVVLEFYQGVFSIHLKMTKKMLLSEETEYCCYLMYTIEDSGYSSDSSDSSFTIDTFISNVPRIGYSATRVREDGCEEIEIKSFFIKSVETGDDDMEFQASVCFPWVNLSLVIHGVEFRPRHMGQEDGRSRCSDSEISLDHLHM
ncbi:unnamed protein product [Cuscuta europaea]|uniref:F-box domain-containing protein n=1 Tax=Cuscuta europaea TaxID=41803 RepID=A0A9P1E5M4_CUSEU|nr:unnamed protein product [Cuscuta europaea]